jgi:transcriptional antiterminator RfaH
MSLQSRWYVVQTRPHAERKAAEHLVRQGFEAYLPRFLKRRRHARRVEKVAAPLFPRYLFVSVDVTTQRWLSIRSTIGVATLVCNGNVPAEIPEAVIQGLRAREMSGLVTLEQRRRFTLGDPVRVIDGAFANCLGLYEDTPAQDRVAILLDLLGRKVRVVIDDLSVAAA